MRAAADGAFVVPPPEDLPGRFAKKGELLGYVIDPADMTVRTVIPQSTIDLVRERTNSIDVRLADQLDRPVPAVLRHVTPGASERLPEHGARKRGRRRDSCSIRATSMA